MSNQPTEHMTEFEKSLALIRDTRRLVAGEPEPSEPPEVEDPPSSLPAVRSREELLAIASDAAARVGVDLPENATPDEVDAAAREIENLPPVHAPEARAENSKSAPISPGLPPTLEVAPPSTGLPQCAVSVDVDLDVYKFSPAEGVQEENNLGRNEGFLDQHRRYGENAQEVWLPNLPDNMSGGLVRVVRFVALLFGVRVANSEMRCAPMAGEWVGLQPEVRLTQPAVAGHLKLLCELGVITHVGNMKPIGEKKKGTETARLYALGVAAWGEPFACPPGTSYIEGFIRPPEPDEPTAPDPEPLPEVEDGGAMFGA